MTFLLVGSAASSSGAAPSAGPPSPGLPWASTGTCTLLLLVCISFQCFPHASKGSIRVLVCVVVVAAVVVAVVVAVVWLRCQSQGHA